jgi:arylsulfatase
VAVAVERLRRRTVAEYRLDKAPYAFTGTVKKVVFNLQPEPHEHEKTLHETAHHDAVGAAMSG